MSESVVLPALGESVAEGTVTRWLKAVGDPVVIGEPLVEVSTDKVDTEVVSTASGIVESLLIAENETIAVGTVLAMIAEAGSALTGAQEIAPPIAGTAPTVAAPAATAPAVVALPDVVAASVVDISAFLSPLVRALATSKRIDPTTLAGTGRGGRVTRDDVLMAVGSGPPPLGGSPQPVPKLRRVLGERAVGSRPSTAQLTTVVEIDVTRLDHVRQQTPGLSFAPFFALAATTALRSNPVINARLEGDDIVYANAAHVNIGVDTTRGVLSPVIRDAGGLDLLGWTRAIEDVARHAREGELTPDDLSDGTFTITNMGSSGALFDTPIVFLPQVAVLGTGKVTRRPAVVNRDGEEQIAIRSMVFFALSYDHRVVDGVDAARYLRTVADILEAGVFGA